MSHVGAVEVFVKGGGQGPLLIETGVRCVEGTTSNSGGMGDTPAAAETLAAIRRAREEAKARRHDHGKGPWLTPVRLA